MGTLKNGLRETLALVLAWVGAAAGIFASAYMLGAAATGEEPGLCSGPMVVSGVAFAMSTLASVTVAGATVFVGGYWSLGLQRRLLRVVMLALVLAAGAVAFNLGGLIMPGCGGSSFSLPFGP